jgi:dihydroorotase
VGNREWGVGKILLKSFRIVDESGDFFGSLFIENNIIKKIVNDVNTIPDADITIDGRGFGSSAVLMPAFIDLHAHFREPGFPQKETLESAALAAAAGGYATVVCMANTNPVIDTAEKARALKARSDALGLIDLYPVLSLTKNMEGRELSGIKKVSAKELSAAGVLMLSEDGKDVEDDNLFIAAMEEAKRLGVPVSCHCDLGGENDATRRAIELGKKTGGHIHIAHVSTKEAADFIRLTKKSLPADTGFTLTCEATPHHIGATEEDARRMGDKTFGRVNPSLRSEADRQAIIAALQDGTIDAIATDHAPHSEADKAAGSPGFTGLETAFAVCHSHLADIDLRRLSALMSANPAQILGLQDRGRIAEGLRADLVMVDTEAVWKVEPEQFKSRGKCSPFAGKELRGKVLMTLNGGKIV